MNTHLFTVSSVSGCPGESVQHHIRGRVLPRHPEAVCGDVTALDIQRVWDGLYAPQVHTLYFLGPTVLYHKDAFILLILVPTCGEAVSHGLSLSLIIDGKDTDCVLRQGGEVSQQPGCHTANIHL